MATGSRDVRTASCLGFVIAVEAGWGVRSFALVVGRRLVICSVKILLLICNLVDE